MPHPIQFVKREWEKFVAWLDVHPHLGWYIAALTTANLLLNALQLVQ